MLAKIDGLHGDEVLGRDNGNNLLAVANPHENGPVPFRQTVAPTRDRRSAPLRSVQE
jgi:hypothetical protein